MMAVGEPTTVNMKIIKSILFLALIFGANIAFAQKAYETISYKGSINGSPIHFTLADGYLPASELNLKKAGKTVVFQPEKGIAETNGDLKFLDYSNPLKPAKNHFVLHKLLDCYDKIPNQISGAYHNEGRRFIIILKKEKKL
ncbi:MAG: hypothetical protein EOO47_11575 [Flavobacterium sp.]|nr:MAG: hypothetical protein EOO47_11575 [Flavobacterium sp.]